MAIADKADAGLNMVDASRPLLVHWIVRHIYGSRESGYQSPLASNRYRAIWPAQGLEAAGDRVEFIAAADWHWPPAERPDVVVLGKLVGDIADTDREAALARVGHHVLLTAEAAVADGAALVADFNDDWFDNALHGHYWHQLVQLAHVCVVGSEAMASSVQRFTSQPTFIVGDILGSPLGQPRVYRRAPLPARILARLLPGTPTPRLRFAWYGNPSNWPAMQAWAERLATIRTAQPLIISAVTQPVPIIAAQIADFNAKYAPAALMELVPWSESVQWDVVRDADVVLVPSDPGDSRKIVKTSNRVTDALHAGRYVIASQLPSYAPYAAAVPLVDDPVGAVRSYLARPDEAARAVTRGQSLALENCSAPVICAQWRQALVASQLPARRQPKAAASAPRTEELASRRAPVRLNLGCGDKILPGYVNVDVVASRAGKSPDVLCDLHKLSVFQSAHADEILAVHVVEHFWRWEVEDILREWVRVLKPGGLMILECPNLVSACEAFLKDPERGSLPTKEGQRTMWVFYGDPAWKDPYMIHRWGYTPSSLQAVMEAAGLCNVRQEPAQFKLREPRDMRLVGEKSL